MGGSLYQTLSVGFAGPWSNAHLASVTATSGQMSVVEVRRDHNHESP